MQWLRVAPAARVVVENPWTKADVRWCKTTQLKAATTAMKSAECLLVEIIVVFKFR